MLKVGVPLTKIDSFHNLLGDLLSRVKLIANNCYLSFCMEINQLKKAIADKHVPIIFGVQLTCCYFFNLLNLGYLSV